MQSSIEKNEILSSLGFSKSYLQSLDEYGKNNFIQIDSLTFTETEITTVDIFIPDVKLINPVGDDTTSFSIWNKND